MVERAVHYLIFTDSVPNHESQIIGHDPRNEHIMATLTLEQINELARSALHKCGAGESQAAIVAAELTDAEAEGIRNVGLGYLPLYLGHLGCGKVNGVAEPRIVKSSSASIIVDADHGFCHPAYLLAEDLLIEKAAREGISTLAITRSSSAGVLGWFVRRLALGNRVSLMFANSSKAVAAHGGKVPFFGTNPLAFGSPGPDGVPLVVDMATASTARVNIVKAAAEGRQIEPGHAIDQHGNPTTDPADALKGAQLPVGGPKGFGLGLMVDLLAGVLTGSNSSHEASMFSNDEGGPPNVGQLFVVFDPAFFAAGYLDHLTRWATALTDDNEVRLPGLRRQQLRERYTAQGIEVPQELLDRIAASVSRNSRRN